RPAVGCGGESGDTLEGAGEMALVGEAGGQGHLGEGSRGCRELTTGKLDPPAANKLPYGTAVLPAERSGHVDRMHARSYRQLREREWFGKAIVEDVSHSCQPDGRDP